MRDYTKAGKFDSWALDATRRHQTLCCGHLYKVCRQVIGCMQLVLRHFRRDAALGRAIRMIYKKRSIGL